MPIEEPMVHLEICAPDDESKKNHKNFYMIKFLDVNHEEYFEKSYHPHRETVQHLVQTCKNEVKNLARYTCAPCFLHLFVCCFLRFPCPVVKAFVLVL